MQPSVVMSHEGLSLSDIYNEYMDGRRGRSVKWSAIVTIFKSGETTSLLANSDKHLSMYKKKIPTYPH